MSCQATCDRSDRRRRRIIEVRFILVWVDTNGLSGLLCSCKTGVGALFATHSFANYSCVIRQVNTWNDL